MAVAEQNPPTLTEQVKDTITSHKVWVRCNVGTLPLEWPRVDPATGQKSVDDDDLMQMGNRLVKTNSRRYRNIETRMVNEQGVGAQSAGFMELDLMDGSHPIETDAQFLVRIKDWIANSGDPRIAAKGVRVEEGNPFPLPFNNWDSLKAKDLLGMVANMLGDDHDSNLEILQRFAGYEISRREENADGSLRSVSRSDVLAGLDTLAAASGDESDDDAVVEDAS